MTEIGNVEASADGLNRQEAIITPNIKKGFANLKPSVFERPKVTMEELDKLEKKMQSMLHDLNTRANEASAATDSAKLEFQGKEDQLKHTLEKVESDLAEAMEMAQYQSA